MKKKGFTLIELLAVIVILAIIALIAVPVVLKIIEKAREGAAKDSALSYMKAVETYIVSSRLDKNGLTLKANQEYSCTDSTVISGKNYLPLNDLVELNGFKPSGNDDYLKLDEKMNIDEGQLTINGYIIIINGGKITSVSKGEKVDAEGMDINYTSQAMEKGSTFKLKAIFTPVDASDQRVTYTSSNENVVTVSTSGIVTAVGNGEAKVTVTSKFDSNLKKECNITVTTSAKSVNVAPTTAKIKVGRTVQLTGTIEPNDVTTNALTWESSNANIAHVDENGLVTGMSEGTATITAKTINNKTATSTITVEETSIEEPSATDVHKGVVYLDPTNLTKKCTKQAAEANLNSNGTPTEIKTGCMKWYIFDDSGSNYKMILDHNTAAVVEWNFVRPFTYEGSNAETEVNKLVSDNGWKVTPRLISAAEINTIAEYPDFPLGNNGFYYMETHTTSPAGHNAAGQNKYYWLFDYTYGCANSTYSCKKEDSNRYGGKFIYGYWTSTVFTPNDNKIWMVKYTSTLQTTYDSDWFGIRPVIEVSKTLIK